jgi:hypothetical protein
MKTSGKKRRSGAIDDVLVLLVNQSFDSEALLRKLVIDPTRAAKRKVRDRCLATAIQTCVASGGPFSMDRGMASGKHQSMLDAEVRAQRETAIHQAYAEAGLSAASHEASRNASSEDMVCQICFCEIDLSIAVGGTGGAASSSDPGLALHCGHGHCFDCWGGYAKEELKTKRDITLMCPKCKADSGQGVGVGGGARQCKAVLHGFSLARVAHESKQPELLNL